jgi:transposase
VVQYVKKKNEFLREKRSMCRKTKLVNDEIVERCKVELKKHGTRGEIGRRLQAIISVKEYGITTVAEVYGIARSTLSNWIKNFTLEGVESFKVKKGRGAHRKLSEEQMKEIREYVLQEGATLTCTKLQIYVKERYSIEIGHTTAYRTLKRLGFSNITPRPRHYKRKEVEVEEFKKKSGKHDKKESQQTCIFF